MFQHLWLAIKPQLQIFFLASWRGSGAIDLKINSFLLFDGSDNVSLYCITYEITQKITVTLWGISGIMLSALPTKLLPLLFGRLIFTWNYYLFTLRVTKCESYQFILNPSVSVGDNFCQFILFVVIEAICLSLLCTWSN